MLHYDLDTVTGLSEFDRRQVCVPKECPKTCARKNSCRYQVYLRQAPAGTGVIQICNHNYLLADAEHRQQGFHPSLKGYGILVLDEAHKLWDAACQMYGESLSPQDFEGLCDLLEKAKYSQAANALRQKSERLAVAFRKTDGKQEEDRRLPLVLTSVRREALRECGMLLQQARQKLIESAPCWLIHRLEKEERTTRLFLAQDDRYILYLKYDREGIPHLCAVSRDIPKRLRLALWEQRIPAILTSGTLKAGNSFQPVMEKTGLDILQKVKTFSTPSPFDYKKNCLLYFPERTGSGGSKQEGERTAEQIIQLAKATWGHTLVLFTSYSLMGTVYNLVKEQLPIPLMEVWRNSQDTIRRFKKEQNAVLFAAGSCWEGIDFPGDMVSSLIIPRLPFPVPDPIREAQRANYMTLRGLHPGGHCAGDAGKTTTGVWAGYPNRNRYLYRVDFGSQGGAGRKISQGGHRGSAAGASHKTNQRRRTIHPGQKKPGLFFCAKEGGNVPENRDMRTVWLYSRSGSQSLSALTAQMRDLLEESERRGYIVAGTSQDQHSGNGIHRAGLKLMMGAIRRGNAHVVMVWNLSRLSWDNGTLNRILRFLQDHGAVLVTAGTDLRYELGIRGLESPLCKRATPMGKAML